MNRAISAGSRDENAVQKASTSVRQTGMGILAYRS
jgi:hypothetical protein